jgi:hypothetical protein
MLLFFSLLERARVCVCVCAYVWGCGGVCNVVIEPRGSHMLSAGSTIELHSQPSGSMFKKMAN